MNTCAPNKTDGATAGGAPAGSARRRLGGSVLLRRERGDKLGPGVNVELAIDLSQVELDRLGRQEQVGRDVTVRRSAPHRRGHAPLLRRHRATLVLRQP